MHTCARIRFLMFIVLAGGTFKASPLNAQCVGIPSVTSLGSNKFPVGLCSPVQANVTYSVAFAASVPPGRLELVYDWGDGSPQEVVPFEPGSKSYNAARDHTYPAESDCEYFVTMAVRYQGKICTNTTQIQKISSWRTDEHNGGDVSLISPDTNTDVHLVCEGEDISVAFHDKTNWNCNSRYTNASSSLIESPNTEYRWQQIVYNTPVSGSKIPNVSVDGVLLTGANGSDVSLGYQDPRGIYFMGAPVLVDDVRRRSSLKIEAPGGFGNGFPRSGDVFSVTLRYWNFCNPYDDPEIPGPPVDKVNGDHSPVEAEALIKVIAPPPALLAARETVCAGTTPPAFAVTGVLTDHVVNWYRYIPGSDKPGALILSGKNTTLPITAHPDWVNNTRQGVYSVWAGQRTNTTGGTNCESPMTLVTRVVREQLDVPEPLTLPPAEVCNTQSFTVNLAPALKEIAGGDTQYVWTTPPGISLTNETETSATFDVNIAEFGSSLFVDRTITLNRQYTTSPSCASAKTFSIRVYRTPEGGSLSGATRACETENPGEILLTGHTGIISRWEVKKDNASFTSSPAKAGVSSIDPGVLPPGTYVFRAVIVNGPCKEVYSEEQKVTVSATPEAAFAGDDQFICSALQSAALNASFSDIGNGLWSYVSSVPSGLPAPAFTATDPNTIVSVAAENAGAYTLRWTVANGACSTFDDVVVDFGTNPTDPDAGNDKAVCGPLTDLEGNVPEKGMAAWSVISGPGCSGDQCPVLIDFPSTPNAKVRLTGGSPQYGPYTFRWTISSGGNNCFLKSEDVTITFEEPVEMSAVDIAAICLDSVTLPPIELEGTVNGPIVSAQWMNVSGGGTVTSTTQTFAGGVTNVKGFYHPSSVDYENGGPVSVKLLAVAASASCAAPEKVVSINFERKPVADAGSDIGNICDGSVMLNAATPLYDATGSWSSADGVIFKDIHDPRTEVSNLPVGETTLAWNVASNDGTCFSEPSIVTITRIALPDVHDITVSECEVADNSATVVLAGYEDLLTSVEASHREIVWFKDSPPAGISVPNSIEPQTNVPDGQIFIARVTDKRTGCSADARVSVRVRPLPEVMSAVISRCEDVAGSNVVSGIDLADPEFISAITAERNVSVRWYHSEADALSDVLPIAGRVMVNRQKEFFARVKFEDTPSCFAITRLNVVVNPQPAITSIIGKESVCQSVSTSLSGDLPVHVYQVMPLSGVKYRWEIPDSPSQFTVYGGGGESDFYVLLQFPNTYTGKIRVSAEMNGCVGRAIEKEIAVSPAPAKPVIQGTSVVCENSTGMPFTVSPNNFPASVYNWEIRRASDNAIGGAYIAEGQLTGNVLIDMATEDVIISVRENNGECVSPVATKVVTVTDPPKANLTIEKEVSCFMAMDGVIRTEVSGGTGPFSGFRLMPSGETDPDNDGIFNHLGQGNYQVMLTDANGCVAISNDRVLQQPNQVVIRKVDILTDAHGYNVSCRDAMDGEITVFLSGGAEGEPYTVTLLKYNSSNPPLVLSGKESVTFRGLSAGTYSLIAEDVNGCSSVPAVAFIVSPPALYAGAIGPDQVICSGDNAEEIEELVSPAGGTGIYEYVWQESLTGTTGNDAEWKTLEGEHDASYSPRALITTLPVAERRYYRRIVKSISFFAGTPRVCEVQGGKETVAVTINPAPRVDLTTESKEICEGEALALTLRLTSGKAPMTFDYATSTATFSDQRGAAETIVTLVDAGTDSTFSLLRVDDANGCSVEALPKPIEVKVIRASADFTIIKPQDPCGDEFRFGWKATSRVDYRWEWGDGTMTELRSDELQPGNQELTHVFPPTSARPAEYRVKLFATYPGCIERFSSKIITVAPTVALNILASDTVLCSGEQITFYNRSVGVSKGTWYYRQSETGEVRRIQPEDKDATFTLVNTTEMNPAIYEVVFEAESNSGCREVYTKDVKVYRSNTARFEVGSIPSFEADAVSIPVMHTSEDVNNPDEFEYFWNYGEQGFSKSQGQDASFDITYYSPGRKEIMLTVVNIAARKEAQVCQSVYHKEIVIPVSRLDATFTVTPLASCLPVTIVTRNTTTGADTYLWRLYRSGKVVSTSNLRDPDFKIAEAGVYDVHLTASVAGTGQKDEWDVTGLRIFDVPKAAFELRSPLIYVPDNDMEVLNFSMGANQYSWVFGDGQSSDVFEPVHAYEKDGKYQVILVAGNDYGMVDSDGDSIPDMHMVCTDTAAREVVAIPGGELNIPNAFTPDTNGPNGGRITETGFNDVFLPAVKGLITFHMQIYDRWGRLIYESHDKEVGWDGYDRNGRLMPAGVYVYKVIARTSKGESVTRAGDVALIR